LGSAPCGPTLEWSVVERAEEAVMTRKIADCRKYPSEMNCTLTIAGEEDEVVRAASEHAASVHGHENNPELREQIRGMLEDERVSV
jgi:predicted small metal-binding protein